MHSAPSLRRVSRSFIVAAASFVAPALSQAPPNTFTLTQARETAMTRSPSLRAARAVVAEARAAYTTAATYPYNPVVEGSLGRRTAPDQTSTDRGIALSQEIEIAGQSGRRKAGARADLAAAEETYRHAERLLLAQVEHAYADAVKGRELLAVERVDVELARTYREHAGKRLEAGSGTQIEDNLARVTLGRAESRLRAVESAYMEARTILGEAMGLALDPPVEPADPFVEVGPAPEELGALLLASVANRADIQAMVHTAAAARERIRLATSEGRPNLVLGGFYDHEGGGESIAGGNVAIAIPIFNRNQGGVALSQAELEHASAELAGLTLGAQREVAATYHNLVAARATVAALRQDVIGSLGENLELLQLSFAAGKIGGTELLVFRREFIESQREYIEAQAFAWQMKVALDMAVGRSLATGSAPGETRP